MKRPPTTPESENRIVTHCDATIYKTYDPKQVVVGKLVARVFFLGDLRPQGRGLG